MRDNQTRQVALRWPSRGTRMVRAGGLALAVLLLSPYAQAAPPSAGTSAPVAKTPTGLDDAPIDSKASAALVAEVDGRPITLGDLHDFLLTLPPQVAGQDFQTLYPHLVEQLIYRTALAIRARDEGLDKDPVLRRRLAAAADQILANGWLHKHLDAAATEKVALARYDRDIAGQPPPEEVRLRIYLAETEKQARETLAALQGGADFATLAKQSSRDPSAKEGGDLGFTPWSAVIPEISGVAQGLAPGEVAPVPIRTRFGWVVVRLEARRAGKRPSFAEVRESLLAEVEREQGRPLAEEVVATMAVRSFALNGAENPNPNAPQFDAGTDDEH